MQVTVAADGKASVKRLSRYMVMVSGNEAEADIDLVTLTASGWIADKLSFRYVEKEQVTLNCKSGAEAPANSCRGEILWKIFVMELLDSGLTTCSKNH